MSDYTRVRDAITKAITRGDEIEIAGVKVRPWSFHVIEISESANVEIQFAVPVEQHDERRRR